MKIEDKIISPMSDLGFKKLMASAENTDVLASFVEDFFGVRPRKITPMHPYSIQEYTKMVEGNQINELRETLRDVSASMDFGNFTAEMQVRKGGSFEERALYYTTTCYIQAYNAEQSKKEPEWQRINRYRSLKPVYAMNILGENLFRDDEDALRIFKLYDPKRQKAFKELISVGFFELNKTNTETENLEHWRQFFLTGRAQPNAPAHIRKAREVIRYMNMSSEERRMADLIQKGEDTRIAIEEQIREDAFSDGIAAGRQEGMEAGLRKGRLQGQEEGREETLKQAISSMLEKHFDDNTIAEVLDISLDELQRMKIAKF